MSEAVADVIGAAPSSPDSPLMEAGLDSLGAVELRNTLSSRFAIELPATATLDYPSIAALAQYIASVVAPQPRRTRPHGRQLVARDAAAGRQVVDIIGSSCVYPGKLLKICTYLPHITEGGSQDARSSGSKVHSSDL